MGVISREALTAGVKTDFWNAYRQKESSAKEHFKDFCLFTNSQGRTDVQVYPTSMPYLRYYAPGTPVPQDGYGEESFSYTTFEFGVDVSWMVRDRRDQKVELITSRGGMDAANSTATLHERILAQLIQQEENSELIPSISTIKAPDGVGPFSTTDGNSAARYGVTGGNLQPLTGFTAAGIEADFFNAVSVFARFKHTHLKTKIFTKDMLRRYLIVFPPEKILVFAQVFLQMLQEGTAGSKSNLIKDAGYEFDLFPWGELEGESSWFVVAKDAPVLPFISSETQGIEINEYGPNTGDAQMARTREEGVVFTRADKWGIGPCFGMIKIA